MFTNIITLTVTYANGCTAYDEIDLYLEVCESIEEFHSGSVKLYPNPASDQVTLSWDAASRPASLRVFDSNGRLILEQGQLISPTRLDLNNWAPGVYFIELRDGDSVFRGRLLL